MIGEIYGGSVDGSGHLTLASADADDVTQFQDWLTKINSPKLYTVKKWIMNYKYDHELHLRFKKYFEMLDLIRGTNFNETFR